MNRHFIEKLSLFLLMFSFLTFTSCEKEEIEQGGTENNEQTENDGGTDNDNTTDSTAVNKKVLTINGYVNVGPMLKESPIVAYPLNANLIPTGESFPSKVKDNWGGYQLHAEVAVPYLELKSGGYYTKLEDDAHYDKSPIYLSALIDSKQQNANLNVLTTIVGARITKLVSEGTEFKVAKAQAEKELLDAFSIALNDNERIGFEQMSIYQDGPANAVLLAASCMADNFFNEYEIPLYIAKLSSDLEKKGTVSKELVSEVLSLKDTYLVWDAIGFLTHLHEADGVTDIQIPPFYTYIDDSFKEGFHLNCSFNDSSDEFNQDAKGTTYENFAISYDGLTVESDVDWMTVRATNISNQIYQITTTISTNLGYTPRTGHIIYKSTAGEVLFTDEVRQGHSGQRIYLNFTDGTGGRSRSASSVTSDFKVNVNGSEYDVMTDEESRLYVDVPRSDKGYGISSYPEMMSPFMEDLSKATLTYKNEVNEYPYPEPGNGSGSNWLYTPYYSYVSPQEDSNSNPFAQFKVAAALLSVTLTDPDTENPVPFAKMVMEIGPNGFASGKVTVDLYSGSQTTLPESSYNSKSSTVTVINSNQDNVTSLLVHPQEFTELHFTFYDASNQVIGTYKQGPKSSIFNNGRYYRLIVKNNSTLVTE